MDILKAMDKQIIKRLLIYWKRNIQTMKLHGQMKVI